MLKSFTKLITLFICVCMFNFANAQADGMVTVTVDMSQYAGTFTTVYLSGSFNGWAGGDNPMTDNSDGTWTVTVMMPGGDNEYKFQVDEWADQEEFVGGESCTITDASGVFTNRFLAVDGDATLDAVCFNSCEACGMLSDGMVTLTVDMNEYAGTFTTVFLSGSFNGWAGGDNPMTDNGDGTWTVTVLMPSGANEYKFQVDEWADQEMFAGGESCTITDASGMFTNRLLTVDGDATLDAVCFNNCEACGMLSDGMVTLTVDMNEYAGTFTTVFLSGSFNGWAGGDNPMTDNGDGTWTVTVLMPSGANEYKFQVDEWADQEMFAGGESCTITDASGMFTNRLLTVDGDATVDAVCFNSCDACGGMASDGMVTVTVDMSEYADAFTTVFLSGSFNGWAGGDNPMTDNGDGTWTITVLMPSGANEYKFQLDEWDVQEEFAGGESCTITDASGMFTNRLLTVDGDATVDAVCFNSCDACSGIVNPQIFPLTFEDPAIDHEIFGFGGVDIAEVIANPDASGGNTSTTVLHLNKSETAEVWGGASLPLDNIVNTTGDMLEMKVWSPRVDVPFLLKIEDTTSPPDMNGNPSVFAEVQVSGTVANAWETLTFDMSTFPDYNASNNYDQVVVFADFGNMGVVGGEDFYLDDIQNAGPISVSETELAKVRMTAYPNPVDQQLNVNFDIPVSGNVSLTLVDVLGRRAQQSKLGNINAGLYSEEIAVNMLSSGTYMLLLRLDGQLIKTQNIIIK